MTDTDETKKQEEQEDSKQEEQEDSKAEKSEEKPSRGRFMQWIIIVAVVALFAGAGFGIGRLLAGNRTTETAGPSEQDQSAQVEDLTVAGSATDSQKTWYYHLEPVVANLNESNVTRYVRASLILEISSEMDEQKDPAFLDEKKPILTNWLTIYLASLGLEDVRGDGSLKRIQSQILDGFNEKLFPDSKPQIKRILFKEFAVQ
ncbi:MAG: flagellar basal body-associated FliL family protein [Planctomycetota bacterium]|jgi:flagellar basal body-associated protein FliL